MIIGDLDPWGNARAPVIRGLGFRPVIQDMVLG